MNDSINLKKFANNSLYNLIRQGLMIFLGILSSIFLTRGLGPDGRGIYALALLLPSLVLTFTRFGVETSTVYYTARKQYDEHTIIGTNLTLSALLSLFSLLVGVLLICFAGTVLFAGVSLPFLVMALALIPLMMVKLNMLNVLLGAQDFRTYNAAGIAPEGVKLILVIVLVWFIKMGVTGAMLASIVAEGSGVLVIWLILRARMGRQAPIFAWNRDYARSALSYGIKTYVGNAIAFLNYRSDKFLVNLFAGTVAVGGYDISVNLGERLWLVSGAVSSVLFPKVASMDNEEQRVQLTLLVARSTLLVTLIAALVVAPLANFIIVLMYGDEFQASGFGLVLLLPGIVALSFGRILANDIAGRGKPEINTIHSLIAFAVNMISNVLLIPRYGFFGASISSSISYILTALMKVISYQSLTGVSLISMLIPTREDKRMFCKLLEMLLKQVKTKIAWIKTGISRT